MLDHLRGSSRLSPPAPIFFERGIWLERTTRPKLAVLYILAHHADMNPYSPHANEYSLTASELKQQLGSALRRAASQPVAIRKHGKVVAWLVGTELGPTRAPESRAPQSRAPQNAHQKTATLSMGGSTGAGPSPKATSPTWGRREEESVLRLVAARDFRPSRWRRAGNPQNLAGAAAMLASLDGLDADRMLALAEQLSPGMSRPERLNAWLKTGPVRADRLLPMAKRALQQS